jgi:hypothetical protein
MGASAQAFPNGWTAQLDDMLRDWYRRVAAVQAGHYHLADRLATYSTRLGIPVVILTSFVGTSLFASVNQQVGTNVKIAGGLISVAAAVLASLMTFLRFPERAEKHRVAAARYGALRREMDHVLHTDPAARHPADPFLKHLRDRLDLLGRQSPEIGEAMWARVSARFEVSEPALSPRYPWRSDGEAGRSEEIEVEL